MTSTIDNNNVKTEDWKSKLFYRVRTNQSKPVCRLILGKRSVYICLFTASITFPHVLIWAYNICYCLDVSKRSINFVAVFQIHAGLLVFLVTCIL